jgi:hypothetical protein
MQHRLLSPTLIIFFLITSLTGCNLPSQGAPTDAANPGYTPVTQVQQAMLTFQASLPQPLPPGDSLYITLLDEVTGLAFNPHKYILQAGDPTHYSVQLPFYLGKLIKYRYSRTGTASVDEYLSTNRPVRYRMYHVEGPGTVQDVINGWTDTIYPGATGRITGMITDRTTGQPVANLLVAAGGEQALTMADGRFLIEGLLPGTHNMVLYSMDGAYSIYQQGAVVAAGSTTPVEVSLNPASLVTVIFTLQASVDTPPDAPIRLAGNLYQLGNTFADLSGGVSSLPARMPELGKLADGRYMVTLSLPAGAYIEYKYTLGDGLWSSELTSRGDFRLRQLIIPDTGLEISDTVDTWGMKDAPPIRFEVSIPDNTPKSDTISIQFNPGFGWLEPLPMWNAAGVWKFDLTGLFNTLSALHYRYCRNAQCAAADDAASVGVYPQGRLVSPSARPGTLHDVVQSWAWYSGPSAPPSVPGIPVTPRDPNFTAGIAFQPGYHPSWVTLLPAALQDVASLGANTLVLAPSWTFTSHTPPILEPLASQDMPYPDLRSAIATARGSQLSVGLFPSPHFPASAGEWWQASGRDYAWWLSFFEQYTNFILHHATLAAETDASTLILGGDWLSPALPDGTLPDGTPSGVPQQAVETWRSIIAQVRQRYSGKLAWALTYPDGMTNPPPFLDAVDEVYLLWSAPLASQPGASLEEMQTQAVALLDQEVQPFQHQLGKPLLLAISYPSIDRGATGCILVQGGGCLDYAQLAPPNTDIPSLALDMTVQANAYNAVLAAINDRSWIAGYVSMGYYPPAILQDKSTSIHGKPAAGVFWYWSTRFVDR